MDYIPKRFAAFDAQINIPLFNAAILLAAHTTDASKKLHRFYCDMSSHLWFDRTDQTLDLESLGIRYFGELLERYEEKLGADIRNLRALTLAMAYALPILTDSMFVGTQKETFLEKVSAAQSGDLYLFAAASLMADESDREEYRSQLLAYPYDATEEIIFTLSVLGDDEAFSTLNTQLIALMGKARTLSVWNSIALYGWVLHHRCEALKRNKRKDGMLMRALLSLAGSRVKEDGSTWKTLMEAGYSRQEILLMNAAFQWEEHLQDHRLETLMGISGEKIAIACILAWYGADSMPEESVLLFCLWLMKKYHRFDVKLDGYDNMMSFLRDQLVPVCPDIVIWMLKHIDENLNYPFDVTDAKWDKLASELTPDEYHELCREQLERLRDAKDGHLRTVLKRYESLTGKPYSDHFKTYIHQEQDAFALHVRLGLINPFDFLQRHIEDIGDSWRCTPRHYVWSAVKEVRTIYAFRFWEQYFAAYTPQLVSTHFTKDVFFHEAFLLRSGYYYSRTSDHHLSCQRDFLPREQQRLLTEWIDASVFTCKPEQYEDYALAFLKCDAVYDWYEPSELRPIYDSLCAAKPESGDLRSLRKRFMSEAEQAAVLQEDENRKRQAAEEAKEQERLALQETMEQQFDGTLHSLFELIDGMKWREDKRKLCLPMVLGKVQSIFSSIPGTAREQCALLGLCQYFLKDQLLQWCNIAALLTLPSAPDTCESEKEESHTC